MEITVGRVKIPLTETLKYLGVVIDRRWTYREHARYAGRKADGVSMALMRLLPNVRCLSETVRRLYSATVQSVLLYAAPV